MAVILMTKRVVVAAGPDQDVAVLAEGAPPHQIIVRLPMLPVLPANQLAHLEAWRLVRAELRELVSPAIYDAFIHFMGLVEGGREHIFISPRHVAEALRQRMRAAPALGPAMAPAAPVPGLIPVNTAFNNGTLLVHMIPGLPNDLVDAWTYDLNRVMAPHTGFEVCSLTLVRPSDTLYGCSYGIFAVVPEDETLAIGINDLGVNAFKKEMTGQGHRRDTLRNLLREHLARTHGDDLVERYADFDRARKARKKTPSNEIVVNLQRDHLIGICVNLTHIEDQKSLSRLRSQREIHLARIRKEVAAIQEAVRKTTCLVLPAWTYDYRKGTLALLEHLQ
jgi:hypothetical protein